MSNFIEKCFLTPSFAIAVLLSFVYEYYPCPPPDNNLLTHTTNTNTMNSIKHGCDCNWKSCSCIAANLIKLGSRTYVSPIHSNTFCIDMHVCITIYLNLNQPTTSAANLLNCKSGCEIPTTFKMELFMTIVNS